MRIPNLTASDVFNCLLFRTMKREDMTLQERYINIFISFNLRINFCIPYLVRLDEKDLISFIDFALQEQVNSYKYY